jgi:hypothetical protein
MTKMLLLSLISIFILFTYQINESLTFSLSHSNYPPIYNNRLVFNNEYLHQVIIK